MFLEPWYSLHVHKPGIPPSEKHVMDTRDAEVKPHLQLNYPQTWLRLAGKSTTYGDNCGCSQLFLAPLIVDLEFPWLISAWSIHLKSCFLMVLPSGRESWTDCPCTLISTNPWVRMQIIYHSFKLICWEHKFTSLMNKSWFLSLNKNML